MRILYAALLLAGAALLLSLPTGTAHTLPTGAPHPGLTVQSLPAATPGATLTGGGVTGTGLADGGCATSVLGLPLDASEAAYYRSGRMALGAQNGATILPNALLPGLPSCASLTAAPSSGYDAAVGYAIGLQAAFETGTSRFFAVPSSVEWYMARCDTGKSLFAPSASSSMARAMTRCGSGAPPAFQYFGRAPTSLGPYALATQGDVPFVGAVPGTGSAWILSCVRLDAIEVHADGTETLHTGLVGHDWFLALAPDDPALASRAALGLQTSTWSDRSGSNGCPGLPPSKLRPEPTGAVCLDSGVRRSGLLATRSSTLGETLGSDAHRDAYLGAMELDFTLGGLRTLKVDRIHAPGVHITAHTDAAGAVSWTLVPITAGHHRVEFRAETLCPGGFGGVGESVEDAFDIITPAGACQPHVHTPGAVLRFHIGFTAIPAGMTVGSNYHGGTVTAVPPHPAAKFVVVDVPQAVYLLFSKGVSMDSRVVYCDQSQGGHGGMVPSDAHYGAQYNMPDVNVEPAWDLTLGTTARSICVIDSGLDAGHPDFAGATIAGSDSFVPGTPTAADDHGHGTHVAGIAAAVTDNGVGVAGVAQAELYIAKALDSNNAFADWVWVVNAIYWCADRADVITMSLTGDDRDNAPPISVSNAVDYAYVTQGRLLVAISGNNHVGPCTGGAPDCVSWPARYANVIAVGCTDAGTAVCGYSNQGPELELAAPGDAVLSTCPSGLPMCGGCPLGDYCQASGTSMAAPHVAGAAALIWSYVPGLSRDDLRNYLTCKAVDMGPAGHDNGYGFGMLDVYGSLQAAIAGSCTAPPCGGTILLAGSPVGPGSSAYGPTTVSVSHTGPWHVTSTTWTASDGATVIHPSTGHETWTVYVGDGNTRFITLTATLGTPTACTVTATWQHTN